MKTTQNIHILLVMLLFAPFLVKAQNANSQGKVITPEVNIHYIKESNKVRLIFINPEKAELKVEIKNDLGNHVYEEFTSLDSYKRDSTMTSLTPGRYTISVKGKSFDLAKQILIKDRVSQKTIEVSEESQIVSRNK